MSPYRTRQHAAACALVLLLATYRASAAPLSVDASLFGSITAVYTTDSNDHHSTYAASPFSYRGADFVTELVNVLPGTPVSIEISAPEFPAVLDLLVLGDGFTDSFAHGVSLNFDNNESVNFIADGNIAYIVVDDAFFNFGYNFEMAISFPAVPIPAPAWLFGSALGALGWFGRKSA